MQPRRFKSLSSLFSRLPSIVWIFIFVGGIILFIGGIIGLFYLLTHVEGAASIIMLVVAWGVIRLASSVTSGTASGAASGASKTSGFVTAIGIGFFALMGMAIDQTGNVVYNQPLKWFYCPSGTQLKRSVDVYSVRPGETNVSQRFSCVTSGENPSVTTISDVKIIPVRFGEYVVIGYILIGLNRLYMRLRRARSRENA